MEKVLRLDIYDARHPGVAVCEIVPPKPDPLSAIRYPCIYWVDYLKSGNNRKDGQNDHMIQRFLETKYLYWLEALILLKALSEGISSISKLSISYRYVFLH
jgi:hypothetical protein